MYKTSEQQTLINEAKEKLGKEEYIMFRRKLGKDNAKQIANDRYYRYIVSMAVTKNRDLFKKLCDTKGEVYARLYLYCSNNIVAVENEYEKLGDYEQ